MGNSANPLPPPAIGFGHSEQVAFYAQYLSDSDEDDISDMDKSPKSILVYARTETNSFFQHMINAKITRKQKSLIFGYVHQTECEYEHVKIPEDIIYLLAAFYCVFRDSWNRDFSGSDYLFIGHKIIKKLKGDRWSISAFGYEVNDKICDVLSIEFKWKTSHYRNGIHFGYIPVASLDKVKWDGFALQQEENEDCSVSVNFVDSTQFHIAHNEVDDMTGVMGTSGAFSVTAYTLIFDFIARKAYMDHNKTRAVDFQCNAIIPAVAIYDKGDLIEVSKYELTKYYSNIYRCQ